MEEPEARKLCAIVAAPYEKGMYTRVNIPRYYLLDLGTLPILIALFLFSLLSLCLTQTVQRLMLLPGLLLRFLIFLFPLLGNSQCNSSGDSPECESPVHEV
jgi:hypothetical protein